MWPVSILQIGLVAIAGCGFQVSPLASDASPSTDATTPTDAATDASPGTPDAAVMTLINRGLVVRYFIDEATGGQAPSSLADSALAPLALPISFGQAEFTDDNGHRGLKWGASQGTGKAELSLGQTKLQTRLSPSRTVTIEVVAQIAAAGGPGSESQITGLRGNNPDFMFTAAGATDFRFFKPFGADGASWAGANTGQRIVLHLVFDTTRPTASTRIELFRDGTVVPKTTSAPPGMNSTVGLGPGDELLIGNRQGQDRSISGTIFYVAYYDVALGDLEIKNNAERLSVSDDR